MIGLAIAASLAAQPNCPATDLKAELLSLHETTRRAHLVGDAALIAGATADRLLLADNGAVRVQSIAERKQFFTGYFNRIRYLGWRDASPPIVAISPDGRMAWMAVEVKARYTRTDRPADGERTFKSSWKGVRPRVVLTHLQAQSREKRALLRDVEAGCDVGWRPMRPPVRVGGVGSSRRGGL